MRSHIIGEIAIYTKVNESYCCAKSPNAICFFQQVYKRGASLARFRLYSLKSFY